MSAAQPRILFVYFTYTEQTLKIVEAMSDVFRERGCDVDPRPNRPDQHSLRGALPDFPMPHPFRELIGMIPAELRRATGEIAIPEQARSGDYDLVVIGSPTWWLSTSVPIRSYLESKEGAAGPPWHHVRHHRRLPSLLRTQPAHGQEARDESGRQI